MATYTHPLDPGFSITQFFGTLPGGFNPAGGHTGEDDGVFTGTPVRAPGDGWIEYEGWAQPGNPWLLVPDMAGIVCVLNCGDEEPTFIKGHLIRTVVNQGQWVKRGEIIAYSGNTRSPGGATFPDHLHWECMPPRWNVNNGTYGRVDPYRYVKGHFSAAVDPTQLEPTKPNHRKNGPQVSFQRSRPEVGGPETIVREIPPNNLEVFTGWTEGQEVTQHGITDKRWYVDDIGYSWFGNFLVRSTEGLTDLTPRKELPANARQAGPDGANIRREAQRGADILDAVGGGLAQVVLAYVHGEPVTGTDGVANDVWYVLDKGFAWSGAFESQSVVGLADLTVVPPMPAPPVAPPEPPSFEFMNGIDVAEYQEAAALNTLGVDFYIIKATEGGGGWADDALASNVTEARLTGRPVGFYHYARPLADTGNTARAEAESFLAAIRSHLLPGDRVFLDWEAENQHRTDWALEWLELVATATRSTPAIYLNADAINGPKEAPHDWAAVEAKYPLWYAGGKHYGEPTGFAPPAVELAQVGWAAGVIMWQYTAKGRLNGYDGDLDLNVWYGTVQDWTDGGAKAPLQDPAPNPPVVTPPPPATDDEADLLGRFTEWLGKKWVSEYLNRENK